MNFIRRKFRRWKYAHRCEACGRRYMWAHVKCPNFPKTIEATQDEINAARNQRIDNAEISGGIHHV